MSIRLTLFLIFALLCATLTFSSTSTSSTGNTEAALTVVESSSSVVAIPADRGEQAGTLWQRQHVSRASVAGLPTWSGVGCLRVLPAHIPIPLACRRALG
ncbi:MAG: hypothetical protein KF753_23220 [Caldilineaceae bacterium]|nr:hypothetical protein [Caldilineaceae bacterium]